MDEKLDDRLQVPVTKTLKEKIEERVSASEGEYSSVSAYIRSLIVIDLKSIKE